ncbi:hypothetical protein D918_03244 [Trichuris suis]|nr:hypothetical protein D918_03244 [Trichuris suis]
MTGRDRISPVQPMANHPNCRVKAAADQLNQYFSETTGAVVQVSGPLRAIEGMTDNLINAFPDSIPQQFCDHKANNTITSVSAFMIWYRYKYLLHLDFELLTFY